MGAEIEFTPDPGGRHIGLSINGTLRATELDSLIVSLAKIRANLEPEVPMKFQKPEDSPDENSEVLIQDDPALTIGKLRDGSARLYLRSVGFGWLLFRLSPLKVRLLHDLLGRLVSGPAINLIDGEIPEGDSTN